MNALDARKLTAEAVGTALLVFFGVGAATLSFGLGLTGSSTAAGVAVTAAAFGLVLLALAYALGPISGCHVNPAVTLGFVLSRRTSIREATGYWIAQLVGGIVGALVLWGVVNSSTAYHHSMGLGADGYDKQSMIGLNGAGAFLVEGLLTFLFVFTVLAVTRKAASPLVAGAAIGLTLTLVHLVGIPLTGTSVNPARSIGPALFVGGAALNQLWLFIVAPLVGGGVAAVAHGFFFPASSGAEPISLPDVPPPREEPAAARKTTSRARQR